MYLAPRACDAGADRRLFQWSRCTSPLGRAARVDLFAIFSRDAFASPAGARRGSISSPSFRETLSPSPLGRATRALAAGFFSGRDVPRPSGADRRLLQRSQCTSPLGRWLPAFFSGHDVPRPSGARRGSSSSPSFRGTLSPRLSGARRGSISSPSFRETLSPRPAGARRGRWLPASSVVAMFLAPRARHGRFSAPEMISGVPRPSGARRGSSSSPSFRALLSPRSAGARHER